MLGPLFNVTFIELLDLNCSFCSTLTHQPYQNSFSFFSQGERLEGCSFLDTVLSLFRQYPAMASAMPPLSADAAATGDVNFSVGDKFSSFAELEEKIDRYCSAIYVKVWKKDARTIEAATKRVGKIAAGMSDALKYQTVKFCCIQGGKKFMTQATERCSS
ncbi:hypothetical protein HPB48_015059 [Haemaphysalis longicornis]|uniref:ZSWIM3 N-terminal domain-containing protein n=1 Tax=Haemaphysalis longicornis TaxID=44386 RepID=A0A9J6GSQ4_HAELO|nr:hypothetical protein HPB48_015059 [Haemaphysalis longicornis]